MFKFGFYINVVFVLKKGLVFYELYENYFLVIIVIIIIEIYFIFMIVVVVVILWRLLLKVFRGSVIRMFDRVVEIVSFCLSLIILFIFMS